MIGARPSPRTGRPSRSRIRARTQTSDLDRLYIERGSECLLSVLGVRHFDICER
jgi:hypothetical protein